MKLNKILTKYHQLINYFYNIKENYEYIHYSSLYGINNILFYLYKYHQTPTENHTITIHLFCYSIWNLGIFVIIFVAAWNKSSHVYNAEGEVK